MNSQNIRENAKPGTHVLYTTVVYIIKSFAFLYHTTYFAVFIS